MKIEVNNALKKKLRTGRMALDKLYKKQRVIKADIEAKRLELSGLVSQLADQEREAYIEARKSVSPQSFQVGGIFRSKVCGKIISDAPSVED
jgi:hypothetical protein